MNRIIEIPVPHYNSQFRQAHGEQPIPRHDPIRVPVEPIPIDREILIAPVIPRLIVEPPDPMLATGDDTAMTRADRLIAESRRNTNVIRRINLSDIREYAKSELGYTNRRAQAINKYDKESFIAEHGEAILNFINSL